VGVLVPVCGGIVASLWVEVNFGLRDNRPGRAKTKSRERAERREPMYDVITEGHTRQIIRDRQETERRTPVAIHLAAGLESRITANQDRRMTPPTVAQLLMCWSGELLVALGSWLQKRSGSVAESL
jgi:hypothetical protein